LAASRCRRRAHAPASARRAGSGSGTPFLRCKGYNQRNDAGERPCNANMDPRDAIAWFHGFMQER
jgi:hypothetical protein